VWQRGHQPALGQALAQERGPQLAHVPVLAWQLAREPAQEELIDRQLVLAPVAVSQVAADQMPGN
jgi:hypothetical protein